MGISVVIPNFNGRKLFEQIIPPLIKALINAGYEYEIIISDDCSTDDSVNFLRQYFNEIKILENKENKGFGPTINKGIFHSKYKFLLLLNSDVKLSENYFNGLFRYFDRDDTFGVMGRIIGWDDDMIQDAGKYPYFQGAKIKTTANYIPLDPGKDDWLFTTYLSGANALVSREKLLELGGFDELFAPFYVEDYELGLRAWRVGWKCYYDHGAVCRHQLSASINSNNSKQFILSYYYRNKMFLHAKHLSGARLFFWYFQLIPEVLIRILTLRFYYVRALKMFFKNSEQIKKSRQRFIELGRQKQGLLTVEQVINKIANSLKKKNIKRL